MRFTKHFYREKLDDVECWEEDIVFTIFPALTFERYKRLSNEYIIMFFRISWLFWSVSLTLPPIKTKF